MLADAAHEPKSSVTYLVVGLVVSAIIAAVFIGIAMIPASAGERLAAERARLYIHSEAFWARCSYNRLFAAPDSGLAAECARCERVIEIFQGQRGTNVRSPSGPAREVYDEANRQIATYQSLPATVHNAMNNAIAQGRGPQVPPYRT